METKKTAHRPKTARGSGSKRAAPARGSSAKKTTAKSGTRKGASGTAGRKAPRRASGAHTGKSFRKRIRYYKKNLRQAAVLAAGLAIAAGVFLAVRAVTKGLGPEEQESSAIEFRRNGTVVVTSVETLDQEYYDAAELKTTIRDAVGAYNDANGGGVKQTSFSVTENTARLVMTYDSPEAYESFNDTTLYVGTVQGAMDAGFDFASIMSSVSNADSSKILNEATLEQLLANEVIILTEQANVVTAEGILYATPNLGVTDETHASAIGTISEESPAIIILK